METDDRPHATEEWATSLRAIPRFNRETMIHRTNLHVHAFRVSRIALALRHEFVEMGYEIDRDVISRKSLHHDDAEVETTDIPSPEKRAMTSAQKAELRAREIEAAHRQAGKFSTLPEKTYIADQENLQTKATIEDQIVNLADKWDGLCETIHELRSGNQTFWPILENYRTIFSELLANPLFEGLDLEVPTKQKVKRMPKIDIRMLELGEEEKFWKNALSSSLPNFYRLWIGVTMPSGIFRTLRSEVLLFPGWREEFVRAKERATGRPANPDEEEMADLFFGNMSF